MLSYENHWPPRLMAGTYADPLVFSDGMTLRSEASCYPSAGSNIESLLCEFNHPWMCGWHTLMSILRWTRVKIGVNGDYNNYHIIAYNAKMPLLDKCHSYNVYMYVITLLFTYAQS